MNSTQAPKRIRSAMAPLISAGVMIANIIWNTMNTTGGIGEREARWRSCRRPCSQREVEVADEVARAGRTPSE